mmetsp:Transcript_5506/g.7822  ORF Transcript_5506/g.7822 Transcript_5506/m.7822 type:complete len:419 (-) Transcript_5506:123-1379(-)
MGGKVVNKKGTTTPTTNIGGNGGSKSKLKSKTANGKNAGKHKTPSTTTPKESESSTMSFSWILSCMLMGCLSLGMGILTPPTIHHLAAATSDTTESVGQLVVHVHTLVSRFLSQSQPQRGVISTTNPKVSCDTETLSNFLHVNAVPGMHVICVTKVEDSTKSSISLQLFKGAQLGVNTTVHLPSWSSSSSSSSNNNNNNEIDDYVVQEIFDAWVNERHLAAERYLFEGVKESLQKLTTLYENGQDDDDSISTTTTSTICIGAITNGRGNPLCMTNTLSSIFDFCVSGEDDGVFPARKPHEGIYQAALDIYHSSDKCIDPTNYIWIHVGDCLGNDVGASADCGAYAVWVSGPQDDESSSVDDGKQKWSTATPGELQVRAELAQAAKKKASATIRTVAELPNAVLQILDQVEASKVVSMS